MQLGYATTSKRFGASHFMNAQAEQMEAFREEVEKLIAREEKSVRETNGRRVFHRTLN